MKKIICDDFELQKYFWNKKRRYIRCLFTKKATKWIVASFTEGGFIKSLY